MREYVLLEDADCVDQYASSLIALIGSPINPHPCTLTVAAAARSLPWNAQMCPQAVEHLEIARVKAERIRQVQLVLRHQGDQVRGFAIYNECGVGRLHDAAARWVACE